MKEKEVMSTRVCLVWAAATLLAATVGPARGTADTLTPPVSAATLAPSTSSLLRGTVAELLSVYVPRDLKELQQQLQNAREFQMAATSQINTAHALAAEAESRVTVMVEEIETTKAKRAAAKRAKDKPAMEALDATSERQKNEKEYLENLRDAMMAEADRVETEQAAMAARVKSLELETLLSSKNEELRSPLANSQSAAQYQTLLRSLLDAQRDSADKFRKAAEKDKRVTDRRIEQLKSLSKIGGSE
jgi:signal transduction histidine kinase